MPLPDDFRDVLLDLKAAPLRIGRAPIVLVLIWSLTVWWGEHATFSNHVQGCVWQNWEDWKGISNPHHVLLVADPQLVDPHTYPDRPWPLSTLTVVYTDLYMKRAYRALLSRLQPHSTLFLGDLFDGGREWSAKRYKSPEERYRQYGQDFWLQEYRRFEELFVETWHDVGIPKLPSENGRRIITSLPGNHDLGFAGGINPYVKSRFEAHFGPTNRIDVLGNHTFVSIDTVSLSAMDQVDPNTGASGAGDGSAQATKSTKIWKPVEMFLEEAKGTRERLIRREVQKLHQRSPQSAQFLTLSRKPHAFEPVVEDARISRPRIADPNTFHVSTSQFPTIILSHVPLYRSDADSGACGPLRERGTHIPLSQGYQYQNVLTPLISKDIIDHLDANQVTQIYSGDDHDYCEIEHDEFTGRIREITVKSVSWAMGVRRPGVQLASLWNPIDLETAIIHDVASDDGGAAKLRNMPKHTVQNHLCLLPDQLGIFLRYGELLGLTLIILLIRALLWRPASTVQLKPDEENYMSIPLPNARHANSDTKSSASPPPHHQAKLSDNTLSITISDNNPVTSRRGVTQLTANGPSYSSYGNIPSQARSRSTSPSKLRFQADSDDWGNPTTASDRVAYAHAHHNPHHQSSIQMLHRSIRRSWLFRPARSKFGEFLRSVVYIGSPVLTFYFYLMMRDM